jgi:PAH dioxygenase large subunit
VSLVSEGAMSVNRRAFFDQDVFDLEMERVFRHTWQFLAHESEIPSRGDYVTRRLGGEPVIVIRSEDGEVRVFLNACRHRGAQLCAADLGNSSHFRCSYHAWTYTNAGRLTGVPQRRILYGTGFDPSGFALVQPPHSASFCGLIFATWDPEASPLEATLGAMAWYLKIAFGKCPMEVVGPPGRLRSEQNWKSGAENFAGDGYHVPSTHQTAVDLGALSPEPILSQQAQAGRVPTPDPALEPGAAVVYTSPEHGHGGLIQRLPVRFPEPTFIGYEEHLWEGFARELDAEQLELCSGLYTLLGNVFPNFSFIEQTFPYQGDGTPPVATVHMRVWLPISPSETEILFFALVPTAASAEWKRASQTAFTRSFGIGGSFETDDYQNWTGIAQMNSGPIAQRLDHDYRGQADHTPSSEYVWPGRVYPAMYTDVTLRALYAEWARLMDGAAV